MSSRLGFDRDGRLVAQGTCPELRGLRWLVLGNLVHSTVSGDAVLFSWLGGSGRPPTPQERAEARAPYQSPTRVRRDREQVPDELLDERAAIAAAYAEQRREPTNLVHAIAA